MDPAQLEYSLDLAYQWIYNSFHVNKMTGSSSFFSLINGWSPPYPETTGYLIPSLLAYNELKPADKNLQLLTHSVKWLLSLQNTDGSYKVSENSEKAIVFDTSQIFLGLLAYQEKFKSSHVAESIEKAFMWLLSCIGEDGLFYKNTYHSHSPSYHSRILWPMLQYSLSRNPNSKNQILNSIEAYASYQRHNGGFENWSFEPTHPFGLTHTIAYTLRGFFEIGLLLNDNNYIEIVEKSLRPLVQDFSLRGKLAGAYNQDWEGDFSFACNSGNAQLALIFYKMAHLGKKEYLPVAERLLEELIQKQWRFPLKALKGGIFASSPLYGKYQRFRMTNWTIKFFMDLIMYKLKLNKRTG